jgi:hypothetical protein
VQLRRVAQIIRIGGGAVVEPEASRTLEQCLARIRQLEEENAHLREAAKTFGDLAERLKGALDAELRRVDHSGGPRDRSARETFDKVLEKDRAADARRA